MIEIINNSDLVAAHKRGDEPYIMHVANCQGVMRSGIAFTISQQLPEALQAYQSYHRHYGLTLGTVSDSKTGVINLHAQEFYGYTGKRYLNYGGLSECIIQARGILIKHNISRVAVPYLMGCDRAGGDWDIVSELLHAHLIMYGIQVVAHQFKA